MAGTFVVQGANLKINFSYVGPVANMTNIAVYAANNLYLRGFRASETLAGDPALTQQQQFDALSNQQKLDLLDAYIVLMFTNLAKEHKINVDTEAARVTSTAAANSGLSINP